MRRILLAAGGEEAANMVNVPRLLCYNDEYRRGAPLRSKNEVARLEAAASEPIELPPFLPEEIARCQARCAEIESRFEMLCQNGGDP